MGLLKAQKRLENGQQKESRPKMQRVSMSQEEYAMLQQYRQSLVQPPVQEPAEQIAQQETSFIDTHVVAQPSQELQVQVQPSMDRLVNDFGNVQIAVSSVRKVF